MSTNPRLQQLANEAARKIKADAITGTSDSLSRSADSQPHPQHQKH